MIIKSAEVALQGYSSYTSVTNTTQQATIRASLNPALRALKRDNILEARREQLQQDQLTLSDQGTEMAKALSGTSDVGGNWSADWLDEAKSLIIMSIIEQLDKARLGDDAESLRQTLQKKLDKLNERFEARRQSPNFSIQGPVRKLSSVMRTTSTVSIENSMSFSAAASIKTADGREINVNLNLNMSQSYYEKVETQLETVFKDPLVINFNASSAQLRDTKLDFDIDCDGESDQISKLMSGSGFLALDKNGDNVINDGSELFGALSGNGFADLAKYDSDNNGWIDEADAVFDKLRIWTHNDDGSSSLIGLGEAGVGAIFLGSVSTDYALGSLADPDGMIRRTGMFLFEDGRAGTVQHVDLAV